MVLAMNPKNNHGGPREGAGAPKKDVVRKPLCIKLPPDLINAIPTPRTAFIEAAVMAALENKMTYRIVAEKINIEGYSVLIGKFHDESGSSIKWLIDETGSAIKYIFIDDSCVLTQECKVNVDWLHDLNFDDKLKIKNIIDTLLTD